MIVEYGSTVPAPVGTLMSVGDDFTESSKSNNVWWRDLAIGLGAIAGGAYALDLLLDVVSRSLYRRKRRV